MKENFESMSTGNTGSESPSGVSDGRGNDCQVGGMSLCGGANIHSWMNVEGRNEFWMNADEAH